MMGFVNIPQPEPLQLADVPEDYAAVASRVGFSPAALREEEIKTKLVNMGVPIYERKAVDAYLNDLFPRPNILARMKARYSEDDPRWIWRPMRSQDNRRTTGRCRTGELANIHWLDSYGKPIPIPVLLTAEKVQKAFPGARFYVSDTLTNEENEAIRALARVWYSSDPFLLVEIENRQFVIERWDEPKFRG